MLNIISFYTSLPWEMKPVMNPMEMLNLLTLCVLWFVHFYFCKIDVHLFFYFSDGWDVGLWYSVV